MSWALFWGEKEVRFMLESDILWNNSKQLLGVLRGDFWGFWCPNDTQTPCLDYGPNPYYTPKRGMFTRIFVVMFPLRNSPYTEKNQKHAFCFLRKCIVHLKFGKKRVWFSQFTEFSVRNQLLESCTLQGTHLVVCNRSWHLLGNPISWCGTLLAL